MNQEDHPAPAIPPFVDGPTTWTCWVVEDGQRYEWRSGCGRAVIRRLGHDWRVRVDGRVLNMTFPAPLQAMAAAGVRLSGTQQRKAG